MAATELLKTVLKDSANLKAYYRFESGAETTDSSGNTNTLTNIATPTYSAGVYGQGVDLASASSQAFSIADGATVKPSGTPYTIGAWFKTSSNSGMIFQTYSLNGNLAGTYVYVDGTGKIAFLSGKNTGTTANTDYKELLSTGTVTSGTWQHVVCSWDSATLRIYLNGVLNNSVAWVHSPVFAATNYVRVGCYNPAGTNSSFFNGSLDEVFLLNGTALSADQVKELYEGRFLGESWPQSGLVAGYHLNGGSTDFSGNNLHGTDTAITYSQANGKFGQGAGKAGGTSKISIANVATLKPTTAITVSAWVNATTYADYQGIVTTDGSDSWAINTGYGLVHTTGTNISFWINNFSNNIATTTLSTGVWAHIVGTYDKQNVKIYHNGNLIASDPYTADIAYLTEPIVIGNGSLSANYGWNGKIDEVLIYNRALTAQEIRRMYALGVGKLY